jgi:Uma2 family endonuclease
MALQDIELPETKPASEWILGRVVQKMTPQSPHSLAQGRFFSALDGWACEHRCGRAGTEWDFALAPPGEIRRPLVPDVAYISYDRIPRDVLDKTGIPRIAPDVVVEVISPGDRQKDVDEKIRVYFACGTSVIFLVFPSRKTVVARTPSDTRTFGPEDTLVHDELPGFSMPISMLFDQP